MIEHMTTWTIQQIFHWTLNIEHQTISNVYREWKWKWKYKPNRIIIITNAPYHTFFVFYPMVDIVECSEHLCCMHNLFTAVTNKKREKKGPKKNKIQKHRHGSCRLQTTWHICYTICSPSRTFPKPWDRREKNELTMKKKKMFFPLGTGRVCAFANKTRLWHTQKKSSKEHNKKIKAVWMTTNDGNID